MCNQRNAAAKLAGSMCPGLLLPGDLRQAAAAATSATGNLSASLWGWQPSCKSVRLAGDRYVAGGPLAGPWPLAVAKCNMFAGCLLRYTCLQDELLQSNLLACALLNSTTAAVAAAFCRHESDIPHEAS